MMGQRGGKQDRLFYSFNLDDNVPADHMLRSIDRYLDLADLHEHLEAYYSHTGRPSVDPELMIRMLLVGYCFGIRSERRLCDEVHLNLAYRWFCRLGLEDKVPDHSSFSKNRHGRFRESDLRLMMLASFVVLTPALARIIQLLDTSLSRLGPVNTIEVPRRRARSTGTP